MFETLDEVMRDIMQRLVRGAKDRRNDMHTPVVATSDADVRVMVLREFDSEAMRLRFHTDSRSPKTHAIGEGAPVGVLLYDKGAKVQIRARGTGRIEHKGPIADAAWAASTNFARRCYLAQNAPGNASEEGVSGLPEWAEGIQPNEEQVAPARENFAVLLIELEQFDWLYLANSGHRRAQFSCDDGGEWEGRWVTP